MMKKEFYSNNLKMLKGKKDKTKLALISKAGVLPSRYIITPSSIAAKKYAPLTKQWNNGIYSYNKNYTKLLPTTDNIVNKIIKSFFTLNPLEYNPNGKRLSLAKKRFKKLSLNRILVSKPEVKHTYDLVSITLHIFNKKKRSVWYKLDHMYKNILFKNKAKPKAIGVFKSASNPNMQTVSPVNQKKTRGGLANKHPSRLTRHANGLTKNTVLRKKPSRINRIRIFFAKKALNKTYRKPNLRFINLFYKRKKISEKKYSSFNGLSALLRKKISKFISAKLTLQRKNLAVKNKPYTLYDLANAKSKYSKIFTSYYHGLTKYKLYKTNKVNKVNSENFLMSERDRNKALKLQKKLSNHLNHSNINIKPKALKVQSHTYYLKKLYLPVETIKLIKHREKLVNRRAKQKNLLKLTKQRLSLSIQKINAVYKLFTYFSNIQSLNDNLSLAKYSNQDKTLSVFSSKMLWDTSKLLHQARKKSNIIKSRRLSRANRLPNKLRLNLLACKPNIIQRFKKMKKTLSRNGISKPYLLNQKLKGKDQKSNSNRINRVLRNEITKHKLRKPRTKLYHSQPLVKRFATVTISKLEMFLTKYKETLKQKNAFSLSLVSNPENQIGSQVLNPNGEKSENNRNLNNSLIENNGFLLELSKKNLNTVHKLNYLEEILEKEYLYLNYLNMISFNNIVYKNWFLNSLKNLISKIYNKKVMFNLVNLKYLHLNSDILSQAIILRLNNYRINTVTKVFRRVLNLVAVSKINHYTYDIHSPVYKYIENHFSRFKSLNIDLFNPSVINHTTGNPIQSSSAKPSVIAMQKDTSLTPYYTTSKIRSLNHIQASTINFIKYKSVFGVRFEASGRLTKRSTASRSIFKLRYKGSLKYNSVLNRTNSSVIFKNNRISNLQYSKISSVTRNGSFGLKGWVNGN